MVIDHIGIVVKHLDEGIATWARLFGYRQATEPVVNSLQKVRVVFLEKDGSLPVKLVEPADTTSPAWACALRGGGLHHLCFKASRIGDALRQLQQGGAQVLVQPQPGEAFGMEQIAFVYAGHGLNVEIIDTEKRAQRRSSVQESDGATTLPPTAD